MRKAFLLVGVLLFILGSILAIGSYFIFNRYSISGSNHFSDLSQEWRFPNPPMELSEGDTLRVGIAANGSGSSRFYRGGSSRLYIVNAAGNQVQLQTAPARALGQGGSLSGYYYVQTKDFYHVYVTLQDISIPPGLDLTLSINVTRKPPDLLFLFVGVIVLLAGVVLIPTAFLYREKRT